MEVNEKNKFELDRRSGSSMSYQTPNIPSDWPFGAAGLPNTPLSLLTADNTTQIGPSGPSASMGGSLGPNPWGHPSNGQSLGYCGMNVQNGGNTSDVIGIRKSNVASLGGSIDSPFNMGWNGSSLTLKEGIVLPNAPGMLTHGLSQFPADAAFIERAARFSSFSGGNFSDMMNPFGIPETIALYSRTCGAMQGAQEKVLKSALQLSQTNELNANRMPNDTSLQIENKPTEGSPLRSEKKSESLGRSNEEARQGVGGSGNESDEAESSGGARQEDTTAVEGTGGEPSAKDAHLKKRKRSATDSLPGQAKRNQQSAEALSGNADNQQKSDQNLTTTASKAAEKQGKQGSQTSDAPKEEYIHVRARRGQATNSHSLAERVRREKISERMKFLQDLVPGCSKVTGKAVMLDEIINYVQSLQRQVEFLSMKLATVNPRLDFNIDGLLAKDILQSRAGPSSLMGFSPNMPMGYPPMHQPLLSGLVQGSLPLIGNPPDVLQRTMSSQLMPMTGGFSEPSQQPPNTWDDELHNAVQMNYGTSGPPDSQDANGTMLPNSLRSPPHLPISRN